MGRGSHLPGVEMHAWHSSEKGQRHHLTLQVAKDLTLDEASQPVVKLHGSTNWVDGERRVMVIGTGKETAIQRRGFCAGITTCSKLTYSLVVRG